MGTSRARQRLLTAWAIVLSLAINLALPALQPSTPLGLPFDDIQICSAHLSPADAPTADDAGRQLCPMCLLLGHQAAFAPAGQVQLRQPSRLAAAVAVPLDTHGNRRTASRPQTARGPPNLA